VNSTEGVSEEILDPRKGIKQFAPNAGRNVKFHSSQQKASRFTAKNVILKRRDIEQVSFCLL